MELPWEAIDYVLLHELTHTRHMHHGPEFWQAMEARLPGARRFARELRRRQPK
jgi:predicted metal-dependent hydrolase